MKQILEDLITHFCDNFIDLIVENPSKEEKQKFTKIDRMHFRIHCNYWKDNIKNALLNHCFETHPLLPENLANWLMRYAHALCEYKKLNRPTLELVHDLSEFRPEASLMETINKKKNLSLDLCNKFLNSTGQDVDNLYTNLNVLLQIEDVEILREFVKIAQYNVNLRGKGNGRYKVRFNSRTLEKIKDIVTPDIDEVVVVEKSDEEELTLFEILTPSKEEYLALPCGTVQKFTESNLYFKLHDPDSSVRNPMSCDLIFRPSRIPIRYQRNALQLFKRNQHARNYLFPEYPCHQEKPITVEPSLTLINSEIGKNPEQLEAVTNIVLGPTAHAPYIIFGPPGTGKTTTIVESMLQLRMQNSESRILVTAGSNAACDTIATRLCEIFNNNKEIHNYLKDEKVFPMLRIYSSSIVARGINKISQELRDRSNFEWSNAKIETPAVEYIHRYGIVIATLCTVGKLVRGDVGIASNDYSIDHFTHVFIDEVAASSETEALIGIMGIKKGSPHQSCRVILSGDHKQLGPVIQSDKAEQLGLGKSLMERLLECTCYAVDDNGAYDHSLQMRLRRNYRSHPEIVRLYNHLYYNNELIAMRTETAKSKQWSVLPNSQFPIAFQVVHGTMSKERTTSSCNLLEIRVLCAYIRQLLSKDGVKQIDIGVITPYGLQRERIKEYLNARNWQQVEVGSVENFQGREKPIIIASLVRSNNSLGFVRCPRRLNVLLSRPKSLLIILGDPKTLSGSEDLYYIINECKINGNYLEANKMKPEDEKITATTNATPPSAPCKTAPKNKKKKESLVKDKLQTDKPKVKCTVKKKRCLGVIPKTAEKAMKEKKIKKARYEKGAKSIKLAAASVKRRSSV